jgi:hypothetical protein
MAPRIANRLHPCSGKIAMAAKVACRTRIAEDAESTGINRLGVGKERSCSGEEFANRPGLETDAVVVDSESDESIRR